MIAQYFGLRRPFAFNPGNPLAHARQDGIPLPPLSRLHNVAYGSFEVRFGKIRRLADAGLACEVKQSPVPQFPLARPSSR